MPGYRKPTCWPVPIRPRSRSSRGGRTSRWRGCSATSSSPDGAPFEGDPRGVLKRNLEAAAELGFTFYVAPELEFFYFADSGPKPKVLDRGGYFDLTPLDSAQEYRRKTINALELMGIPVEHSHHEVAPSQHEIIVRYTDALTMADNIMTFRLTVKEVALEHGIYATFMPKPLEAHDGSGMHLHLSLFEGDRNAFAEPGSSNGLSKVGQQFVAGLLDPCRRDHGHHQPVGQLVQAAGLGLRCSDLDLLGPEQPVGTGAGAAGQERQGIERPGRIPLTRRRRQPLPGVVGGAGGGSGRHPETATSCPRRWSTTSTS